MDIQAIWIAAEPYIMAAVGALGGGTIIYTLARVLLGRLLNRFSARYDVNDMADKVAAKLAGKTLNVDVTAVTETKLKQIEERFAKHADKMSADINSTKRLQALMGGAVSRFKALTDEERTALTEAVQAVDSDYIPPEPEEIVTVKIEPILFDEEKAEKKDSLVNFD